MTRIRACPAITLVVVAASLLAAGSAQAAPGDLDASFGEAGMQTTDFGGSEDAAAAAIQQDGKIVVAGRSFRGGGNDFALARYNPDGSLDASFSGDGKVVTDFGGNESGRDLALQPDGKIVVAGDGVIARYNADGTLDSSFGTDGSQATGLGGAVAIQADGKLIVLGVSVIARYNADGTPDGSFGAAGDGRVTTGFSNADVALTAGGKIVVSGTLEGEIALARYNQDGTLDVTFLTPVWWGSDEWGGEVVVQPDGKVVVTAGSYSYVVLESWAMILRYNPDGTPDGTFNGPLWAATPWFAVALQSDGKIVGLTYGMLARFLADGSQDASFGTPATEPSNDVAIQADGKIVTVGSVGFSGEAPSGDFAIARYHGDAPDTTAPDTTISGGPSGLINDSSPTFNFDSSEPGSSFECRVDGGTFSACSPPHTTASLSDGPHSFEVRAIDAAGNSDPSPVSRAVTVDTDVPETTITSGPTGTTSDRTATFSFGASEPGSTVECRVDAAAFSPCSSPHTTSQLGDGTHTFEARAIDGAGNTDTTPAARSWTILADYRAEVFGTAGLVSYWRLGETSGTTAIDAKGTNHGAYRNGVLLGQPSALLHDANPSAGHDGTNDYVSVADHASLDTGDRFTLEAWVKRSHTSSSTKTVLSKGGGSWRLSFVNNVLTLGKGGSGTIAKASVSTIDTTGFHHFAATKSGATVRLYIDGVDRTGTVTNRTTANTSAALNIGRYTNGSEYFPGLIDEVAIYNLALGAAQVQQHFKASGR